MGIFVVVAITRGTHIDIVGNIGLESGESNLRIEDIVCDVLQDDSGVNVAEIGNRGRGKEYFKMIVCTRSIPTDECIMGMAIDNLQILDVLASGSGSIYKVDRVLCDAGNGSTVCGLCYILDTPAEEK